jgi:hypothetical protein
MPITFMYEMLFAVLTVLNFRVVYKKLNLKLCSD